MNVLGEQHELKFMWYVALLKACYKNEEMGKGGRKRFECKPSTLAL